MRKILRRYWKIVVEIDRLMNKRYWLMFRMLFIFSLMKRVKYMKAQGVFRKCGENVMIISRKIPLYSRLISIGNNVWIASGVSFLTHDVVYFMLKHLYTQKESKFAEKVGCIKIGNNVLIGVNTIALYDVKIGNNIVI